jgi:voltage-gated potassium channel
MYYHIKKQVHTLLHPSKGNSIWDKIINIFLILLILLNILAVMLETESNIYEPNKAFFHAFDWVSVYIFSVEYILRLWSCTHDEKYRHWFWGRIKFIFSWESLIDLAAILPIYLHSFFKFDLRALRLLRLLRLLRIFRLTSYMRTTKMIANVFRSRFQELLLSLILTTGLIIISACLMYFAEHDAQKEKFSSIPKTLYWSVVTLTTTGYGDMTPETPVGRLLTGVILMIGVAIFALPAGIITAGFLDEMRGKRKQTVQTCPHCGKPIDQHTEPHSS